MESMQPQVKMAHPGSGETKRKIYETVDWMLKNLNELNEISCSLTHCLERMDGTMPERTVQDKNPEKMMPYEEMDLFTKIGYLAGRIDDERAKFSRIYDRLNSLV